MARKIPKEPQIKPESGYGVEWHALVTTERLRFSFDRIDEAEQALVVLHKILRKLSFRERTIIRMRHGIPDGKWHTITEIAATFKSTKSRVKAIHDKAFLKIRLEVEKMGYDKTYG